MSSQGNLSGFAGSVYCNNAAMYGTALLTTTPSPAKTDKMRNKFPFGMVLFVIDWHNRLFGVQRKRKNFSFAGRQNSSSPVRLFITHAFDQPQIYLYCIGNLTTSNPNLVTDLPF